jgi:hypothetical protein
MLMAGLTTLFYVMGIESHSNPLLDLMLAPQSMQVLTFYSSLSLAILSVGTAFYFGFIAKNAELAMMSVITPIVASSLWHFGSVVAIVMAYSPIIGILILAPAVYLFAITINDYMRGRD